MYDALPGLPPKVAKAICDVMGDIEKLSKDERNPHANYQYAGIESYLEMVRPLCAKHGLIVLQDEVGYEFRDSTDKFGKALTWLVMTFAFGLAHSSGETWPHRIQRTGMVQASMGSQAFGAAQSYALKSFLRSLELIATGDTEDADSHEQRELPKSARQARKEGDYPEYEKELREAQTLEELSDAWEAMQPVVTRWGKGWREAIIAEKDRNKERLSGNPLEADREALDEATNGSGESGGSEDLKQLLKDSIEHETKKGNKAKSEPTQ